MWIDLLHRGAQRGLASMFQAQLTNSNTARITLSEVRNYKRQEHLTNLAMLT